VRDGNEVFKSSTGLCAVSVSCYSRKCQR